NGLNGRQLPEGIVLDRHSDVAPALIEGCRVVPAVDVLRSLRPSWDAVIAPDGGAVKRAAEVARLLEVPLYHGWKTRDIRTGTLMGFGLEPISPAHRNRLLVVDDLCDGGRTFLGLADSITANILYADRGMDLSLYVTHGYFTQGTELLHQRFSRILTTDSVLGTHEGVEVVPAALGLFLGNVL